ncbi:MAG TPA: hypothetical protein VIV12_05030 [Streptosporangiaceae bacterium]
MPELGTLRVEVVFPQLAVLDQVLAGQQQILAALAAVQQGESRMAMSLDALAAQVQKNTDAEASAVTLLNTLSDLIRSSAADPAKVTALADSLKASSDALAAAIVANTPAAPPA